MGLDFGARGVVPYYTGRDCIPMEKNIVETNSQAHSKGVPVADKEELEFFKHSEYNFRDRLKDTAERFNSSGSN